MPVNDKVRITDYNTIQSRISNLLGTGSGTYGYGQPVVSSPVSVGDKVSATAWNNIRTDVSNVYAHIIGHHVLDQPLEGTKIRYVSTDPPILYDGIIDTLEPMRFAMDPSNAMAKSKGSAVASFPGTYGNYWLNNVSCTAMFTFSSSNAARNFFNSGCRLRLSSSRTGGTALAQNDAWSALLNSAGVIEFTGQPEFPLSYYDLTNSYQQLYTKSVSGIYSYTGAEFRLSIKCDVANNSTGTAKIVYVLAEWIDTYPGSIYLDGVDGNLALAASTLEATGPLKQGGLFLVESPVVTFSNFTVS